MPEGMRLAMTKPCGDIPQASGPAYLSLPEARRRGSSSNFLDLHGVAFQGRTRETQERGMTPFPCANAARLLLACQRTVPGADCFLGIFLGEPH